MFSFFPCAFADCWRRSENSSWVSVPHTCLRPSKPPHAVQEVSVSSALIEQVASRYISLVIALKLKIHFVCKHFGKLATLRPWNFNCCQTDLKNKLMMSFEKKKKCNTFRLVSIHATASYICILLLGNSMWVHTCTSLSRSGSGLVV